MENISIHLDENLKSLTQPKKETVAYRGWRDELVDGFVKGINSQRVGTKFKPISHKQVALRINGNPFFKQRDGEIELLLKDCVKKGNYKKFFWVCPIVTKKK